MKLGKEVLLSMQPEWVDKVFSWIKGDELRKRVPDLTPPFTCYVYCTLDGLGKRLPKKKLLVNGRHICNGMVVGEFVCDKITKVTGLEQIVAANEASASCVGDDELLRYLNGADEMYFMHIAERAVYGEPVPLYKFETWNVRAYWEDGYPMPTHELERAPQSWCYVRPPALDNVVAYAHRYLRWIRPQTECKMCQYRCVGPAAGMCFLKSRKVADNEWCIEGVKLASGNENV